MEAHRPLPHPHAEGDAGGPGSGDKSRSRRLQARSVVVGGVIALVASAIGVVGTVWSAHLTNQAFDRRTQRDFLHTQRVAAFTKFLGDEQAASKTETDVNIALLPAQQTKGYAGPPIPQLADGTTTLDTDAASIRLVADGVAYDAAEQVIQDHRRIVLYLIALASCTDTPSDKAQHPCPKTGDYDSTLSALNSDLSILVAVGKTEID